MEGGFDLGGAFEELDSKAFTNMPGLWLGDCFCQASGSEIPKLKKRKKEQKTYNVTVHQPSAGIIILEGNHQPTKCGQGGDIAARGILEVEDARVREATVACAQEREVVAVQVDRVRHADVAAESNSRRGLDDPVCPLLVT
jgi:hypothetical protein